MSETSTPVIYQLKIVLEKRPLGIPVMRNRAAQALVKAALEPEWESKFENNSYGFRPGRSAHDAIEAIFNQIIAVFISVDHSREVPWNLPTRFWL